MRTVLSAILLLAVACSSGGGSQPFVSADLFVEHEWLRGFWSGRARYDDGLDHNTTLLVEITPGIFRFRMFSNLPGFVTPGSMPLDVDTTGTRCRSLEGQLRFEDGTIQNRRLLRARFRMVSDDPLVNGRMGTLELERFANDTLYIVENWTEEGLELDLVDDAGESVLDR